MIICIYKYFYIQNLISLENLIVKMIVKDLIPRDYQKNILETCKLKNTLVVIPTGIGKTAIAILLAENRIKKYPDSKIIVCSPTKPLCSQHVKSFLEHTSLKEDEIKLYTGATKGSSRTDLFDKSKIIIATPQTIKSDIENERISLKNVSLLCIDEAHRSRMKYANTFLAENYIKKSDFPRILALTASPGSSKEKIDEICKNLYIEDIEIRTELDEDVSPYMQEKGIEWIKVDLPKDFLNIKYLIKEYKQERMAELKSKFSINKNNFNKRDLLTLQFSLRKAINRGNKGAFWGISLVAQLLKICYAQELIETQGIKQLNDYWTKLKFEETKAAKKILESPKIQKAMQLSFKFKEDKHPKMHKLLELVNQQLKEKPESRIIVFANYRNTVSEIYDLLKKENLKPTMLIGQKEGLSQKEQVKTIKDFSEGVYNVLIGTSISEEGLDIATANLAVFYEPVASEIRTIQRSGRVGRTFPGRVVYLITKDTKDESSYWSSKSKEKKMKFALQNIKTDLALKNKNQLKLNQF